MRKQTHPRKRRSEQDNIWKELLDRHFAGFLKFFFPRVHAAVDWSRKPVFLDKELPKLGPRHLRGGRVADKLAKVWRKDGQPIVVMLHSEIQGRAGAEFNERMFVYNYRIGDRHNCPVVSLGVVTGRAGKVVLGRYETELWGCETIFKFPVAMLQQWRGREAELLASDDPFALVVLAHLKVAEIRNQAARRYAVKRELLLLLHEHKYTLEYQESLLRFLDALIKLPPSAEDRLDFEIEDLTGEKTMPYITHWERRGQKQGLLEAVTLMLRGKFGKLDAGLKERLAGLSATRLKQLAEALAGITQPSDLEQWLQRKPR